MKINSFYSHSLQERLTIVTHWGEFICRILYFGFHISLYVLDGQFVEVYHNAQTYALEEVELLSFTDEKLHVFAVQVNLSNLYS